jgi:hypothetical protein
MQGLGDSDRRVRCRGLEGPGAGGAGSDSAQTARSEAGAGAGARVGRPNWNEPASGPAGSNRSRLQVLVTRGDSEEAVCARRFFPAVDTFLRFFEHAGFMRPGVFENGEMPLRCASGSRRGHRETTIPGRPPPLATTSLTTHDSDPSSVIHHGDSDDESEGIIMERHDSPLLVQWGRSPAAAVATTPSLGRQKKRNPGADSEDNMAETMRARRPRSEQQGRGKKETTPQHSPRLASRGLDLVTEPLDPLSCTDTLQNCASSSGQ